jgi:hypothetical protein
VCAAEGGAVEAFDEFGQAENGGGGARGRFKVIRRDDLAAFYAELSGKAR